MATVIDSLIITLGLDPSDFTKGQKEVAASFVKTKEEAVKSGKAVEKSSQDMTEALGKATKGVFDLFAAFIGGKGLKEFIQDATGANNALGNLSMGLGSSPQLISAWGMAAQRMGGSAASTQASIQALSDSLVDLRTQGKALPDALFQLEAKSGKNIDFLHGWEKMTIGLADAASTLAKTDPAAANRFLRQLGLDPVTANLLIQQGPRMQAYLETMKRLAPSDKDIKASQGLTNAWATLSQQFSQLATKISTAIAPMLELFAAKLGGVVEAISRFVEAHPNLTSAFAAIFLVMTGAKILSSIKNILALRSALVALSAANAASSSVGLLGLLARLGVVGAGAAAVAAVMNPTDLNDGEDEIARQRRYGHGGGDTPLGGNDAIRQRGHQTYHDTTNYTGSNAEALKQAAAQLGTSPHDLAMVMAYETRGTFSPHIHGGAGNNYQGLIQFGPSERRQFGANDKQSFKEQLPAVVSYLKTRGFKPGMGLADLYSTINAGSPGHYGASDGHGTVLSHVARMKRERESDVQRFLNSTDGPKPALWSGGLDGARSSLARAGASHAAALNNISNDNRATTTSSSNEMHVGTVNVNAPNATDAHGIAKHIDSALAANMFASHANYGPN